MHVCMTTKTALKYILLLEPSIPRAIDFYQRGLGATLRVATTSWAELDVGHSRIALKHLDRTRLQTPGTGTAPMLVFDVDNVQDRLTRLLEMGARMDGGVQYMVDGSRLAVVHSPTGYCIGIVGE